MFWFVAGKSMGHHGAMAGISPRTAQEDKRIRPEKPVIKGGIFPSTSR